MREDAVHHYLTRLARHRKPFELGQPRQKNSKDCRDARTLLLSDYYMAFEVMDLSTVSHVKGDVVYQATDLNISWVNLSKRVDAHNRPVVTLFALKRDDTDNVTVELFCCDPAQHPSLKDLASPVTDLNTYVVHQADAQVMWKYQC